MTWRFVPAVHVLCLSLVGLSGAQTPRVVSPEVLPDRRVTVRFYAPQAREVRIFFERGGNRLSKRENGVWEATIGPLDPGSYRYGFAIDGASVTDPSNIDTERLQVVTRSILHVPGAGFLDTRNVPHGAISVVTYYSAVLKKSRRFHIYTPPGYEANQQKYPVLYLLHGANESDQFIGNTKTTVEMLKRHGFPVTFEESTGGHNWVNWRNYRHEFAAKLFR